ncbi:hypothetical protein Hanom_Chr17g01540771 [Helianthus anomalus]
MCSREFTHVLRNEDVTASWSSSRFFGKLKMDSRMLYFRCCSKLDCTDLILRSTWVGCGFMSRICCLFF